VGEANHLVLPPFQGMERMGYAEPLLIAAVVSS